MTAAAYFCSSACLSAARTGWWRAEAACDFMELLEACSARGEKMPLMAARLACMTVAQQAQQEAVGGSGAALAAVVMHDAPQWPPQAVPRGNPLTVGAFMKSPSSHKSRMCASRHPCAAACLHLDESIPDASMQPSQPAINDSLPLRIACLEGTPRPLHQLLALISWWDPIPGPPPATVFSFIHTR